MWASCFFFQAEDGIRDLVRSRGLGDVYKRQSDIDVVLTQGYGFPRWEGGPVFWARQQDPAVLALSLIHI